MTTGLVTAVDNDSLAFLQGGGAMGELIRSHDWRHSELGLPEQWPAALKSAISSVLNSGTAMHIAWGENLLQFYNDAYTPILTDGKHPAALGRSVRESFPEIWDFIWPLYDRVLSKGEAIAMENAGLMMCRDGMLKESFFSFSYSPLKSLSGQVCGVAAVCWETTEDVIIRRRERGLRLLTEKLAAATSLEEVRFAVRCHVLDNRGDLPFLLWYERDEIPASMRVVKCCGISPEAPLVGELGAQDARTMLGEAFDSSVPVARLLSLPEPATDWLLDPPPGVEVKCIAIEPLCFANYSTPDAYLVFGIGTQCASEGSCKTFHESICHGIERAVRRISAAELERREGVRQFDAVMRLTLEAAHIGYWDFDLLTRIPKRSLLHDQIFGYDEPVADWSYERFLDHVLPQDREQFNRVFKAGVDAKAEWDIECRIIRRDGALRWIWLHGDVLTDAAGAAVRTVGIIVDITDRKHIEEAMRESEQRFASAFEHAPIGKALVALDGRLLKVNRALCEFLGYSDTELLAHTFQTLTHRDDIDPSMAYVRRMLLGEISTFQMEERYIHASGQIVPALLSVSMVRDDDGQARYFIAQVQDITARRTAEDVIERAMLRLNEAQRVGNIGDWEYVPATESITWSPQLFEIFGRDPRLGPPRDYAENSTLFDVSNRAFQHHKFQLTIESGQPQDYELVARRPDGTPVHIHVLAIPLRDDSGTVLRIHGTVQDISSRKRAEADTLRLAERLTTTLDSMSDAFFTVDRDWRFTFLNRQAELLLGRRREELLGRNIWAEFPTAVGSAFEREYNRALTDNVTVAFEELFEALDIVFSVRAHPSEHGLAVYFRDVTQNSRASEALRASQVRIKRQNRVYAVLGQINALMLRKPHRDELFREACRVAVELGDYRFAWVGLLDRDAELLIPIASAGEVADFFEAAPREVFECQPGGIGRAGQAIRERKPQVTNEFGGGRHKLGKKEMEERGIHSFAHIPLIVEGEAIGVLALYGQEAGFFDDEEMRLLQELAGNISLTIENIERQERLDYLAYYDPLTGLANRALFLDRVSQHLRSAASGGHPLALFLVDLERFKNVNDSLGWQAGDNLLKQVAKLMARRGGDTSLLARVGPNLFAAVVPRVRPGGDLKRLLEKAMAALGSHPFTVERDILRVTAKVGVALFPDDGDSAETLFQYAEAALRQAKASGNRYLFHSSAMTAAVAGKLSLENKLRRALDNEEFVLHYQPKVNLASGKVTGAEALIRWNDLERGLVPPGEFIPLLEETGLIQDVGRWAMRKAIEDYLRWCDAGLAGVRIAVNVSALQLRSTGFVAEVAEVLRIDPRAASGLELEITESMVMGNIDDGLAILQAIRAMGVTVALDDFGTGFSSLSYLARLPIDTLKIDRSFIHAIDATPEGLALVSTIITLAHSLRHNVVAEGVETAEQSRLLRLLDCDEMQGFHFGRPVPSAAFEASYLTPSAK